MTSFVNPRLLERIDLYPGNFSARFGRKMGGIIDVGIRDPKTDGYHGMADVNLIDASFIVEGPVGKRGAFALAGKRSYIDFWFKNVVPADAIGITAAPVYYDYQAIYTYRPESGGKVRTMFFGSGDEFRLNLKQPADGDPTIRGSLGQGTSFRRLQTIWQRSLGANVEQEITAGVGTIEQDLTVGPALGFSFNGFDQFLRAEWRAQLGSHVKLIGGFDGYAVELDVSYVGPTFQSTEGNPATLRPAHRPADGDVQGPVPQLPPGRLSRGGDPGGRAAVAGARRTRRLLQRDRAGFGQPAVDRALQAGAADHAEGRRGPVLAAAAVRRERCPGRQPEPGPQPGAALRPRRRAALRRRRQRQRRRLLQAPHRSRDQRRRPRRQPAAGERRQGPHLRPRAPRPS